MNWFKKQQIEAAERKITMLRKQIEDEYKKIHKLGGSNKHHSTSTVHQTPEQLSQVRQELMVKDGATAMKMAALHFDQLAKDVAYMVEKHSDTYHEWATMMTPEEIQAFDTLMRAITQELKLDIEIDKKVDSTTQQLGKLAETIQNLHEDLNGGVQKITKAIRTALEEKIEKENLQEEKIPAELLEILTNINPVKKEPITAPENTPQMLKTIAMHLQNISRHMMMQNSYFNKLDNVGERVALLEAFKEKLTAIKERETQLAQARQSVAQLQTMEVENLHNILKEQIATRLKLLALVEKTTPPLINNMGHASKEDQKKWLHLTISWLVEENDVLQRLTQMGDAYESARDELSQPPNDNGTNQRNSANAPQ